MCTHAESRLHAASDLLFSFDLVIFGNDVPSNDIIVVFVGVWSRLLTLCNTEYSGGRATM